MKKTIFCALLLGVMYSAPVRAETNDNLIKAVSAQTKLSPEQAEQQIQSVFSAIESELKAGREVSIRRFGKFHVQQRAARQARNPKTGAPVQVPARNYARFNASELLKSHLNEKSST